MPVKYSTGILPLEASDYPKQLILYRNLDMRKIISKKKNLEVGTFKYNVRGKHWGNMHTNMGKNLVKAKVENLLFYKQYTFEKHVM